MELVMTPAIETLAHKRLRAIKDAQASTVPS